MKSLFKQLPGVHGLLESNLYGLWRHGVSLRTARRENSTFTGFLRLPTQYEALSGPVLDFLLRDEPGKPLRIASVGCSNGAEAYTIASVLRHRRPELNYVVMGCDVDRVVIERAQAGLYDGATEVFNNKHLTDDFVRFTFDVEGQAYRIKPIIKERVSFFAADALDASTLAPIGRADIVYAQNFLFHLAPDLAYQALANLCRIANSRAAIFIDGTDLPLRNRMTRKHRLSPLDYKLEQIHNEARWARADGWPQHYWGLEPFLTSRRDWKRRYATVFLKNGG